MKFFRIFIIITALLISTINCTKKTVQIPVLDVTGIQDTIYDNSQIWIFLEVKDGDTIATLNRKNSIATTSWIYNIDKNLPMRLVIPHLQKLIEKREKPTMHPKGEDDLNYFSYVDSGSNLLSMVKFDVIYFEKNKLLNKDKFLNDSLNKHLFLTYKKDKLTVNDSLIPLRKLNNYLNKESSKKKLNVHLNFDTTINYQNYMELKARLQNINNIELDTIEYIY
ncbi:hypothetical protein UMM65_15620 [Aureibaculum sp. 2210JD6-5]|uniref:hypothetical protein n=1 Tax=Aureibaculum sp. 2210JD6-5 TaxID=3103957 RepID=UPI002AAC9080|nr:hypothetical protein [Aureibaculum sp. 2210JD6-5]MDY7396678.1 hypothetical protein [Aureibaculum sp. 2210JD6-5]